MKKKIIIIGVNSFVGSNLYSLLKDKFQVKKIHFKDFFLLSSKFLNSVSYIVNCSSNKKYVNNKYAINNDFDLLIANKIKDLKCKLIFLSTRKVYKIGDNLKETSKLKPNCNYSKNKLITENKLIKIIKNKILILRVSNLIGLNSLTKNRRKIHNTFIDNFFYNANQGKIFNNGRIYKDFLTINKFAEIIHKLISGNIIGIYNVSSGRKTYLNQIVKYLNFYNKKECILINSPKNFNKQVFYLNNLKLSKKINLKINVNSLENYCKLISKSFFNK